MSIRGSIRPLSRHAGCNLLACVEFGFDTRLFDTRSNSTRTGTPFAECRLQAHPSGNPSRPRATHPRGEPFVGRAVRGASRAVAQPCHRTRVTCLTDGRGARAVAQPRHRGPMAWLSYGSPFGDENYGTRARLHPAGRRALAHHTPAIRSLPACSHRRQRRSSRPPPLKPASLNSVRLKPAPVEPAALLKPALLKPALLGPGLISLRCLGCVDRGGWVGQAVMDWARVARASTAGWLGGLCQARWTGTEGASGTGM
ncbi:hypothetical protein B0I29_111212 [Actinoplanes lutulentus]|uniref:Uncharacterized protein n=1 Tax=Actinoplanes lutulentus TaxID=1287878 RepID=A0A327ZE01_9ACTN|nr:hypothetical protein B0I29_111212 [Actinoplanes lutulentus]